jgi:glycosyltransferase involved in cell wall biosynthesis
MTSPLPSAFILFHGRFPSEKAASLFVAEHARALATHRKVTLIVPNRHDTNKHVSDASYEVSSEISVVRLPTIDLFSISGLGPIPFLLSSVIFSFGAYVYLSIHARKGSVVFANDLIPGLAAVLASKDVVYEVHDYPEHWKFLYRFLFSRVHLIISTNAWKTRELSAEFPAVTERILMERNGVNLSLFSPRTMETSRTQLGLDQHKTIAVYTGHLYAWKGVDTLLAAAKRMPRVAFYFVGGTAEAVASHTKEWGENQNIHFVGHVPHSLVPVWQSAANVLVLPNTGTQAISINYTSPMKLFEYMASGRPIVASNLPSIAEVIGDDQAYFFTPDDAESLVATIETVLTDTQEAERRAVRARERAEYHTWEKRAQRIIQKLSIL